MTEALEDRIARLEHRLGTFEDVQAIRTLQHAYGYYIDKCLYDEAAALFASDAAQIPQRRLGRPAWCPSTMRIR